MQAVIPTFGSLSQIRIGLLKIDNNIELRYDFFEQ